MCMSFTQDAVSQPKLENLRNSLGLTRVLLINLHLQLANLDLKNLILQFILGDVVLTATFRLKKKNLGSDTNPALSITSIVYDLM